MSTPSSSKTTIASTDVPAPVNRHAPTPLELQRIQLAKLLKDPSKEVVIPQGPKEKTLRPPREMMKNVQGSSAGAGSGEFHVYKQSRRREYERLKLMDDQAEKDAATEEFEQKKREREEEAEAKTAKNRAKRQKKKQLKGKGSADAEGKETSQGGSNSKKRKVAEGSGMTFKKPGEETDEEENPIIKSDDEQGPNTLDSAAALDIPVVPEENKIIIYDD